MASPHLSDEDKHTAIQPLRRAIGQTDDGSRRQDVPSNEEVRELPVHIDQFIRSVRPGFRAEWVIGVTDEIARDCGYESAEQCVMEVSRVGGQVRQVVGGSETVEERGAWTDLRRRRGQGRCWHWGRRMKRRRRRWRVTRRMSMRMKLRRQRRPSTERHGRVKQAETRVDSGLISQRMSGRMLPL